MQPIEAMERFLIEVNIKLIVENLNDFKIPKEAR